MKKIFISTVFLLSCAFSLAQGDKAFYLYKTDEDFFENKKSYRGEFQGKDAKEVKLKDASGKKTKFSIKDSAAHFFGCEYENRKYVWNIFTYYLFVGGNKKVYAITSAITANYDADGYANEFTYGDEGFNIVYFDVEKNVKTEKIEEFLKAKPKLLEKYTAQKNSTDVKTWRLNKFVNDVKYLKMYVNES